MVADEGRTLEVQIRTREMHESAELGIAAHWRYKEGGKRDPKYEEKIAWLRSLMDWWHDAGDAREFVDSLRSDVFQDRVYVFTPKGKLVVQQSLGHGCCCAPPDRPPDSMLRRAAQA